MQPAIHQRPLGGKRQGGKRRLANAGFLFPAAASRRRRRKLSAFAEDVVVVTGGGGEPHGRPASHDPKRDNFLNPLLDQCYMKDWTLGRPLRLRELHDIKSSSTIPDPSEAAVVRATMLGAAHRSPMDGWMGEAVGES